jgi:hypothetical protein
MMLALLAAALVGDLIFLPSLLTGPLGYFFKGRRKTVVGPQPASGLRRRFHAAESKTGEQRIAAGAVGRIARHRIRRDGRH